FAHLLLLLPPPPPLTPSPSPYPTLFRSHITYVFTPQAHESRGYHLPLYQNNQGYHFRNRSWGTRFDQTVADVRVTVYRGLPIVDAHHQFLLLDAAYISCRGRRTAGGKGYFHPKKKLYFH